MRKTLLLALVGFTCAPAAMAGNWFSAGPWANGAYYPGQFDGIYTASMFNGNPSVISGVLGFGLRNGAPTTASSTTQSTTSAGIFFDTTTSSTSVTVDPNQNYFVVYVDGIAYAGTTVATVNNNANQVSGGLFNGLGPSSLQTFLSSSNIETTFNTNVPPGIATSNNTVSYENLAVQNTCGGGFNATLTGKKDVITFVGNNTGQFSVGGGGVINRFSLNGIKVSDITATSSGPLQ